MLHRLLPVKMFLIQSLHDPLSHPVSVMGVLIDLTQGYNLPQPLTSFYDIRPSFTTHATLNQARAYHSSSVVHEAHLACPFSEPAQRQTAGLANFYFLSASAFRLMCPLLPASHSCHPSISDRHLHPFTRSSTHPQCCRKSACKDSVFHYTTL